MQKEVSKIFPHPEYSSTHSSSRKDRQIEDGFVRDGIGEDDGVAVGSDGGVDDGVSVGVAASELTKDSVLV